MLAGLPGRRSASSEHPRRINLESAQGYVSDASRRMSTGYGWGYRPYSLVTWIAREAGSEDRGLVAISRRCAGPITSSTARRTASLASQRRSTVIPAQCGVTENGRTSGQERCVGSGFR